MRKRAYAIALTLIGVLVAAGVWIAVAACGRSQESPKTAASSGSPALPHGSVPESLTFQGDLSGRLEAAHHGNAYTCGGLGSMFIVDPIVGTVHGKSYELGIQVTGFKGPGTYKTGGELTPGSGVAAISVWVKPEGTETRSASRRGTIVINNDRRSGTLDADLGGKLGTFHVSGEWRCPPDF
jgi:hypothetical protein